MFNPLGLITPAQQEQLAMMQVYTTKIHYVLHTEDNRMEISLQTEDAEAENFVPQLQEAMVGCISQVLYHMFGIQGERV